MRIYVICMQARVLEVIQLLNLGIGTNAIPTPGSKGALFRPVQVSSKAES